MSSNLESLYMQTIMNMFLFMIITNTLVCYMVGFVKPCSTVSCSNWFYDLTDLELCKAFNDESSIHHEYVTHLFSAS